MSEGRHDALRQRDRGLRTLTSATIALGAAGLAATGGIAYAAGTSPVRHHTARTGHIVHSTPSATPSVSAPSTAPAANPPAPAPPAAPPAVTDQAPVIVSGGS